MVLYIVRHGISVARGTNGILEEERPLTGEGMAKMNRGARGLRALDVRPDFILASPLIRARQTAEILQSVLGEGIPLETIDGLASGNLEEVYKAIQQRAKLNSIMLVGHQPSLGDIAGEIAWGPGEHSIDLKKGGVCCLQVDTLRPAPRGILLWLLTPVLLRAIK